MKHKPYQQVRSQNREATRVLWALYRKDFVEALKNKNTIINIGLALAIAVFYKYMAVIFDHGGYLLVSNSPQSQFVEQLSDSLLYKVSNYDTTDRMLKDLRNGELPELALVLPEMIDEKIAAGETISLDAYVLHWVTSEQAAEMVKDVEAEIIAMTGSTVVIQVLPEKIYPTIESSGSGIPAGMAIVYVMVMVGLLVIPHIMLEEKKNRTLDVLLVSPASAGQVVLAKALVGLTFCLLATGAVLALNAQIIVNWWIAILAVLLGSMFIVCISLMLGTKIEDRGQLSLWGWVLLVPLLVLMFVSVMSDLLPAFLVPILKLIPTATVLHLLLASFAYPVDYLTIAWQLGWLLFWAGLSFMGVVWMVRRSDREADSLVSTFRSKFALAGNLGTANLGQPMVDKNIHTRDPRESEPVSDLNSTSVVLEPASDVKPPSRIRSVFTITRKDVREALRNKVVISIILGTLVMVGSNAILPLLSRDDRPAAVVYDPENSEIIKQVAKNENLRIRLVETREEMESLVSEFPRTIIGLEIPADFDQQILSSEQTVIKAYSSHTSDSDLVSAWVVEISGAISSTANRPIQVDLSEEKLYPSITPQGTPLITALLISLILLTLGIALVPVLFVEEKESHTIDLLLVSPVTYLQLIIGKFLAGVFYCAVAAVVLFVIYNNLFVHWWVALLAALLGTLFAVAIGLLVGVYTKVPSTAGGLGAMLLLLILITAFIPLVSPGILPDIVHEILQWSPGLLTIQLFKFSMAGFFPLGTTAAYAAALGGWILVFLLIVWLRLRRETY